MTVELNGVLAPYFARIERRGGLPRWLNQALKTRPELPRLLQELVGFVMTMESLCDYRGEVRMKRDRLYHLLAEARPEWVLRQPHRMAGLMVARGRTAEGQDVPMVIAAESRIALDQATALGKMVHLLQEGPRGIWGLDHDFLKKIRRANGPRA